MSNVGIIAIVATAVIAVGVVGRVIYKRAKGTA